MDTSIRVRQWPIRGAFSISRGKKTTADVLFAEISDGGAVGRGEAVPYARYGETLAASLSEARAAAEKLNPGDGPGASDALLPPGAARNVLDSALWDLAAKRDGLDISRAFASALNISAQSRSDLLTAFTISLDTPGVMAEAARQAAGRPLLKLKLGEVESDLARLQAVRQARPEARLIADANEGWDISFLTAHLEAFHGLGLELIEQPLPADQDAALEGLDSPVLLCADESVHGAEDAARLSRRYGALNVKLDKTGGPTSALTLVSAARKEGLAVMIGCMVGSSLAMAPACRLAEACQAEYVDLDGPLLLAEDYQPSLQINGAVIAPCPSSLWG